jgi:hypothetical protein
MVTEPEATPVIAPAEMLAIAALPLAHVPPALLTVMAVPAVPFAQTVIGPEVIVGLTLPTVIAFVAKQPLTE